MKKIVSVFIVSICITAITFAASEISLAELVKSIMAVPAEKIIAPEVMDNILDDGVDQVQNYREVSFRQVYYYTRSAVYSQVAFNKYNSYEPFDAYVAMRTLVVTKIKQYLHSGDHLVETYKSNRENVRTRLAKLNPEQKLRVQTKLVKAFGTFTLLKNPEVLSRFVAFQKAEKERHIFADLRLLSQNLTTEEVAGLVASGELNKTNTLEAAKDAFISRFNNSDEELAMFAGRRAVEGGSALIDQYLVVIQMMIEDATM